MIMFIIFHNKISDIWKMMKALLIHRAGDENDPGNFRLIVLISVIYRNIFGIIAQVMISNENRSVRKELLSLFQKGFVPRVNGCGELVASANWQSNQQ
jgi:hypothetical protein